MCEMWHATRKKCACVRKVRCYLYTHPFAFTTFANVWTRNLFTNNCMADECARLQRNVGTQGNLGNKSRISFLMLVWTWIVCCLRLPFSHHFWFCHSSGCDSRHCWGFPPCRVLWPWRRRRWRRCREVRLPVLAEPFQNMLFGRIHCVVLSCPHVHRNMRHTLALFLLKAHQSTCCCFVIFSFPQWSCLRIWVVTSHDDHVFITISLAVRRVMLDVNRGEVVEVLDVSFSPPDRQMRSSENLFVLPSAEYRGMVSVSLLLVLRLRPLHCVFAIDCVCSFFFVTAMLHDTMALSKLQISSCLDYVGAKRLMDTCSILVVRVSGKKDTK